MAIVPQIPKEEVERLRQHRIYDDMLRRVKELFAPPPNKKNTKRYRNIQQSETKGAQPLHKL